MQCKCKQPKQQRKLFPAKEKEHWSLPLRTTESNPVVFAAAAPAIIRTGNARWWKVELLSVSTLTKFSIFTTQVRTFPRFLQCINCGVIKTKKYSRRNCVYLTYNKRTKMLSGPLRGQTVPLLFPAGLFIPFGFPFHVLLLSHQTPLQSIPSLTTYMRSTFLENLTHALFHL